MPTANNEVVTAKSKKARLRATPELAHLLLLDESEAETIVRNSSANDQRLLIAEFNAYHKDCLTAAIRLSYTELGNLIKFTKACVALLNPTLAVSKLIEIASYCENVGEVDLSVEVAEESLTFARTTLDKSLQRKALSRLGACYSRQFDFERSCICYEHALTLAIELADPLYEFAVLSNIVTLLDAMGLTLEARKLTQKISSAYQQGTPELDSLHLQNAINGFRFAAALNDVREMERLQYLASETIKVVPTLPEIWTAYFEVNDATLLVRQGRLAEAGSKLRRLAQAEAVHKNVRAAMTVLTASVECALAAADDHWLKDLRKSLESVLPQVSKYPPDYEIALELLVQVSKTHNFEEESGLSLVYSRRLQEHVVSVRHRQFLESFLRETN